ncbi:Panacea domain-containing protein [Mesorhizobium sp. VNQ89]|uniref:Panacea domain-containing protein n=1 Tax=Mesorhizobium quangtriensis TaxID=3157709 RepID=UPI0032B85CC9
MLITHEREKLIDVIVFFAHNTRKLGKTKLYKLLYFLDFEHFKQTGRSVTGLRYHAWPMGPVPVTLHDQIESPPQDLAQAVHIAEKETKSGKMLAIAPSRAFSGSLFSKREMRLMHGLAKEHYTATADDMVEATHLENLPWHQIYEVEGKKQAEIPYDLAVRADEREAVLRVANERKELLEKLPNEPGVGIL